MTSPDGRLSRLVELARRGDRDAYLHALQELSADQIGELITAAYSSVADLATQLLGKPPDSGSLEDLVASVEQNQKLLADIRSIPGAELLLRDCCGISPENIPPVETLAEMTVAYPIVVAALESAVEPDPPG